MSSEHIETKRKIKEIADIRSFEALLRISMLSDEDKEILRLLYVQNKSVSFVADSLGFSEVYIKKRHKAALQKLNKLL